MEEIVTIKIHKDKLQQLVDSSCFEEGEYLLVKVDVTGFDYSGSDTWKAAKAKCDKAYKDLKLIEFNIRYPI
jgi:hypothetical protein